MRGALVKISSNDFLLNIWDLPPEEIKQARGIGERQHETCKKAGSVYNIIFGHWFCLDLEYKRKHDGVCRHRVLFICRNVRRTGLLQAFAMVIFRLAVNENGTRSGSGRTIPCCTVLHCAYGALISAVLLPPPGENKKPVSFNPPFPHCVTPSSSARGSRT